MKKNYRKSTPFFAMITITDKKKYCWHDGSVNLPVPHVALHGLQAVVVHLY